MLRVWVVPLAATTILLALLLEGIPYASGYGWVKIPLGALTWQMWGMTDWEHAKFVPLICLLLVYFQWKNILRARIRGSNAAAGLLLLGLVVYGLGLKAEMQYFGFAAIQLLLAGAVLWFWGAEVFRRVAFAWLFLLFTWPMPFLDSVVALPLRLVMSHVSYLLLNLLGTPCVQSGTAVLSAPDFAAGLKLGAKFQIDIADPCSGLHSLFALMMISALAGYVSMKKVAPRLLVFLASVPLAIAGNVFRILMLVWASERFGTALALGTNEQPSRFHLACGFAVYLVALLLLFGLITILNSRWLRRWAERLRQKFRSLSTRGTVLTGPGSVRPAD